jgi:hypothetical protein
MQSRPQMFALVVTWRFLRHTATGSRLEQAAFENIKHDYLWVSDSKHGFVAFRAEQRTIYYTLSRKGKALSDAAASSQWGYIRTKLYAVVPRDPLCQGFTGGVPNATNPAW